MVRCIRIYPQIYTILFSFVSDYYYYDYIYEYIRVVELHDAFKMFQLRHYSHRCCHHRRITYIYGGKHDNCKFSLLNHVLLKLIPQYSMAVLQQESHQGRQSVGEYGVNEFQ